MSVCPDKCVAVTSILNKPTSLQSLDSKSNFLVAASKASNVKVKGFVFFLITFVNVHYEAAQSSSWVSTSIAAVDSTGAPSS